MPPRTRTKTGALPPAGSQPSTSADTDPTADPDFLALSRRQQRAIDRAYDTALKAAGVRVPRPSGRSAKRRRIEASDVEAASMGGGGFVVDDEDGDVEMDMGGGFVPEGDDGAGGADDGAGGGGFVPDEDEEDVAVQEQEPPATRPVQAPGLDPLLPLTALPGALAALELPWDDDVQAVFQGVAGSASSDDAPAGATRRDFRAVCAAMMEPEDGAGDDQPEDEEDAEMAEGGASDDSADEYDVRQDMPGASDRRRRRRPGRPTAEEEDDSASDSPLSALSDAEPPTSASKSRRKPGAGRNAADPALQARRVAPLKLSREQKDWIGRMWETMFEGSALERGQRLLGREQVKRWAGVMGEMWSDDELTEMIELFSTQPGKRGLSFEDFSTLLIRGGLV